jgi:hypothetical protein
MRKKRIPWAGRLEMRLFKFAEALDRLSQLLCYASASYIAKYQS